MVKEQTLILIKPDALAKSLTGNILTRLSETKLDIIGAKVVKVSRELAERHYANLKGEPYYEAVIEYIQGKPYGKRYERVMAMIYQGEDAIEKVRKIIGETNPEKAVPTTIRGQYGRITTKGVFENVIHGSGNEGEAEKEIKMWFKPDEVVRDIYPTKTIKLGDVEERVWA